MYLEQLNVSNFRKIKELTFKFNSGLNIILGANNIGKTALIDALRSLFSTHEEPYLRLSIDDIHRPKDGSEKSGDIVFRFIFAGLSLEEEADFLPALVPAESGKFKAHITVSYSPIDIAGRMRQKRWCGENEDIGLTSEMLENLRGVYLQPLRDASQGLKPGRHSQLARLLRLLGANDKSGKDAIETIQTEFDERLKKTSPIGATQTAISGRHQTMLGAQLAQSLSLGISGADFNKLSSRLNLQVDTFEIEQNGLGFNNLIYMAVVLSEMVKDPNATYRGLIVEEPEAHLHPQLQTVLLDYLENIDEANGENNVQIFVTSHSPTFASLANLNSTICMVDTNREVKVFFPREAQFDVKDKINTKKRQKLERYLDVTRAELFFARRIIFVEGAAELMLISVLAKKLGEEYNLRKHAISLLSTEGLNFDCFLPLFGEKAIQIPISAITDADPVRIVEVDGEEKRIPLYPNIGESVSVSANTTIMLAREDKFVKIFHGVKTLEYDLALHEVNRKVMLDALAEIHPEIAKELREKVNEAKDNTEKAKVIFCGMFERGKGKVKVQKGTYGQALAQAIDESETFEVPHYIAEAIEHVCSKESTL